MLEVNVLYNEDGDHSDRILQSVKQVNAVQSYFRYRPLHDRSLLPEQTDTKIDGTSLCDKLEAHYKQSMVIAFIDVPFFDEWFFHYKRKAGAVTLADWETRYAPPGIKSYIVFALAHAAVHFETDITENMSMKEIVHEPPTGCLMDLCLNKPDIRIGMVAGNLCPSCVGKLKQYGASSEGIESIRGILRIVRGDATGRPLLLKHEQVFVVMRFSEHDENDNAFKYGIKPAIEESGLTCERADNKIESSPILRKVERYLRSARLVIVKVDEPNLNVFFELGFAMGLDKQFLLVSDSKLTGRLPTNISNWECLAYTKGNYEELKQRVKDFLTSIH